MAEHELRIGIPGSGASDFATSPVAALTITKTIRRGPPSRSPINFAQPADTPTINGVDIITGPSSAPKFLWTITCFLTSTQARQLNRLFGYQNNKFSGIDEARADGRLRLIDETRYIDDYERQQHGRTLLASFPEADNASHLYGYGVFNVMLILGTDFLEPAGRLLNEDTDQLTFSVREV